MPLFSYFIAVGSFLAGLLLFANTALGPAEPLPLSTNFAGIPKPWKAPKPDVVASVPLPVEPAPAAGPASPLAGPAAAAMAAVPSQPAQPPSAKALVEPSNKKTAKVAEKKSRGQKSARQKSDRRYAEFGQRGFGRVW
jgi:hypothetical protein